MVIFFASNLGFVRPFCFLCSEISSEYPGSLTDRASKLLANKLNHDFKSITKRFFMKLRISWCKQIKREKMTINFNTYVPFLPQRRGKFVYFCFIIFISNLIYTENLALAAFGIFVKAIAVVKTVKRNFKEDKMSTTTCIK